MMTNAIRGIPSVKQAAGRLAEAGSLLAERDEGDASIPPTASSTVFTSLSRLSGREGALRPLAIEPGEEKEKGPLRPGRVMTWALTAAAIYSRGDPRIKEAIKCALDLTDHNFANVPVDPEIDQLLGVSVAKSVSQPLYL